MKSRIYLDNNATTGLDASVLDAMLPELSSLPANPSSIHAYGQIAKSKLSQAREILAKFLKVRSSEIVFTSGGTESMNMLIQGISSSFTKGHIITTNVEHACVYECVLMLQKKGWDVTFATVGPWGAAKQEDILSALRPDTKLIVLSAVNSETGVKTDIDSIASLAKQHQIPFFVDGVALLGKELFTIPSGVSGMGFSAHKIHGPKGVGFAYVRSDLKLTPLLVGGGQEFTRRSGTENLPGIVGLSRAISLVKEKQQDFTHHMQSLQELLEKGLMEKASPVLINGEGPRVCNTSNLYFPGVDGETLLIQLDQAGIAASHGSACASGSLEPSRVLLQMGYTKERARSSIRFSLSRMTTKEEIEAAIISIASLVDKLRKL